MSKGLTSSEIGWMLDLGLREFIDYAFYKFLCNRCSRYGNRQVHFDRRDFVKYLKKYCRKFEVKERTSYRIVERLAGIGLIEIIMKGYGSVLVRVNFYYDQNCQDKLSLTEVTTEEKTPNPEPIKEEGQKSPSDRLLQQQHIVGIKQLLKTLGLSYRQDKTWYEIASYSWEVILATVNLIRRRLAHNSNSIRYLPGFFLKALREEYYLDDPVSSGWIDNLRSSFSPA